MRSIGLIIAGSLVMSCGSSGADNSSEPGPIDGVAVGANDVSNEIGEAQPVTEIAGTGNEAQIGSANHCLMQGDDRLEVAPIRAVGTEPFWAARVEGRCVTYSHPEDQEGVRIWARYSQTENGLGTWVGQLDGKKFEMRVRPESGCSDGMSDERYPIAVDLIVNGENRKGCAKPL